MNKRALLKSVNENLSHYHISYAAEWQEYKVVPRFVFIRSVVERLTYHTDSFIDAIETAMSLERRI